MAQILIIDDEENVRAAIVQILESEGHAAIEAADGEKGIQKFRETPVDLVITDILMPEKEGLETISELRKIAPDVKVIAMSGGGRLQHVDFLEVAERLGACKTLKKPFQIEQLCNAVNGCLA